MGKKHFTEEQIAFALRQQEAGTPDAELTRKLVTASRRSIAGRGRSRGWGGAEFRHLRQLEEENWKLKQLVADLRLGKRMLQDVLKKMSEARSSACSGERLQVAQFINDRRVCQVLRVPRAGHRYQCIRDERAAMRIRLRNLAGSRIRYGYRWLRTLLQNEELNVNHKLICSLYFEEGLIQ